jgi:hypothetical protein
MAEKLSYTREAARARTGGTGIRTERDRELEEENRRALQFSQAVDAGYDPVQYGYDPVTRVKVGRDAALRSVAAREAETAKLKVQRDEATKAAMLRAGLTEDGKARAPKTSSMDNRRVMLAPPARSSFSVGENGEPVWTGGYIDGRIAGQVMKEERAKAEKAGLQPFGPSKSEREYDAYMAAMDKYKASQKPAESSSTVAPATTADPTTALDNVDTDSTPAAPASAAAPTAAATATEGGADMRGQAETEVTPATRSALGDTARLFNTATKAASVGGVAANRFIQNTAQATKNLAEISKAADDVSIASAARKSAEATSKGLYKAGVKLGAAENKLNTLLQASGQTLSDFPNANAVRTQAVAEAAQVAARSKSPLGKLANVASRAANSKAGTGVGKAATGLGAAMDVVDSVSAVKSVYKDDYDSNTPEAAAYRKRLEEAEQGGVGGAAKFLASETYNLTPAVLGGGGNTVSGVKNIIDTQTNLKTEIQEGEGEIAADKLRASIADRRASQRQPYLEPLLPAADPNLPPAERKAAQQRAFAKLPSEDRSKILEQAEVNMRVDQMLSKDPTLRQFIESSDPERASQMMDELRTQASEQRRLFNEKRKNAGRP